MPRNTSSVMGFPPFRGAVRQIILSSLGIYIVILLLMSFAQPVGVAVLDHGILDPAHIRHGWLWQFVTYAFMYVDPLQRPVAVGDLFPRRRGGRALVRRAFTDCSSSVICRELLALHSLTHVISKRRWARCGGQCHPDDVFVRRRAIMLFPIDPDSVKWIVLFSVAIEVAYLLLSHFALFYFVLLLGLEPDTCGTRCFDAQDNSVSPRNISACAMATIAGRSPRRSQVGSLYARPRPHRHLR